MHRDAAYAIDRDRAGCPTSGCTRRACSTAPPARTGTRRSQLGTRHGFRNAQTTVLAPTGTIGLLMDCDTTGIEPDFALVKFKKLAGGGYFKIVNQSRAACAPPPRLLGAEIAGDRRVHLRHEHAARGARNQPRTLREKGLTDADLAKVEAALPSVFDLELAFATWILGEDAYARLGAVGAARQRGQGVLSARAPRLHARRD